MSDPFSIIGNVIHNLFDLPNDQALMRAADVIGALNTEGFVVVDSAFLRQISAFSFPPAQQNDDRESGRTSTTSA